MIKLLKLFRKCSGLIVAIFLMLLSWGLLILLCGENPLYTFTYIFEGAFKNIDKISSVINKLFLYFFTALAFCMPSWAGMNNVGGDGQLVFGGFCAALIPQLINTGCVWLNIFISLMAAVLAGALWSAWPAWLKVRFGINEVVTTLLSTYIITYFCEYMAAYPLRIEGSSISRMEYVPDNFIMPHIGNSKISTSIILVIVALVIVEYYRKITISGFQCRMTGKNLFFARQGGVHVDAIRVWTMAVGGAMAGLAGGLLTLSVNYTFQTGFSADYGMIGMLVALISGTNPIITLCITGLFCVLQIGAINMQVFTSIPSEITSVMQSLMVFFIAARGTLSVSERKKAK